MSRRHLLDGFSSIRNALFAFMGVSVLAVPAQALNLSQSPLYITASQPPLVLLTMSRDHKLYYEAYNDYSDIDGDGNLDVGYKPSINYYGYFDSFKCYSYSSGVFTPVAVTANKKCTDTNDAYWSGDFLNYVTTSRMDALRKVFYGGYRSTDTSTQTILERVYIPQDAHAWGKEYESIARDGYDIREYTPLSLPATNTRHLFASVSLNSATGTPLMRVLDNSKYRIWEWVSIEQPVAGTKCMHGSSGPDCAVAAGSTWEVVPASATAGVSGLTRKFYNISGSPGHPTTEAQFNTMEANYGIAANLCGTDAPATVVGSGNPFAGVNGCNASSEYYMTIVTGTLNVPTAGTYKFSVDGDDAVDVYIDGTLVASYWGGHGTAGNNDHNGTIALTAGAHTIKFRHEEQTGGDSFKLNWELAQVASSMTDYTVRVEVCKEVAGADAASNYGREANCQAYGSGTPVFKPTGLLHKYGQGNGMYFGLLTGSYDQNTNGGILRKAMSSITNEIESSTGIYKESGSTCGTDGATTCVKGIVGTVNRLKITSFGPGNYNYACGWIATRAMNDGECEMWGNPLAEMMYEGLRYFAGETSATSSFTTSSTRDNALGLPRLTSWTNPFSNAATPPAGQFPKCAKPYFMLVSDVYPSFDSDSLPGKDSNFGSAFSGTSSFNGNTLSVSTQGQSIWNMQFGNSVTKNIFAGQVGASYDGAPTVKSASTFGNIRGLAPSDPTRQGSYYSASIAYFGKINDINAVSGGQKTSTYSIALAAPLPNIEIPVPGTDPVQKVKIVPFAKSVGGYSISATQGQFQPTNQIVDFYVDTIKNTTVANADSTVNDGRPYYKFRINYEDVEQGADHDMDAIATYEIKLNANNSVTINMTSDYAAGSIMQHMGYVISGTSADGIYLEVRDKDTAAGDDPNYFLDTPQHAGTALPLTATRTFTPSSAANTGEILKDPLWYAAKFGGFNDANNDNIPNDASTNALSEWDADGDGVPDNYYLVVNPTKLETQLNAALAKIKDTSGTSAALSTNSFTLQTDTLLYQSRFNSDGWSGELNAYPVSSGGIGVASWQAQTGLASKTANTRVILTYDHEKSGAAKGAPFRWDSMTTSGALRTTLNKNYGGTVDNLGSDRVTYLRGDADNTMRTRPFIAGTTTINKLGDIINSQAQYVGRPAFGYGDASYAAFATSKASRTKVVYVGANDGMVHGFNATNGEELLAYVPNEMYRVRGSQQLLSKLTSPDYGKTANAHRYYVDGTPTMGDICTGTCLAGTDWKTILVGGLNGGGQGIYALDITNPSSFSEANAATIVKWEFLDRDHEGNTGTSNVTGDADLGYTYSRPFIIRLCSSRESGAAPDWPAVKPCEASKWYVIFGNGYNNTEADGYASTTGDAALYILDADTGYLVKKLAVQKGSTTDPNGMSELAPVDVDGDGVIDYIYAGDLKGNLWRFNVYDDSSSNWGSAFTASSKPAPLFTAMDQQTTPVAQPITAAPDIVLHPQGGLMVIFGTGRYVDTADPTTTQVQTVYGIWDKNARITNGRTDLVQQTVNMTTITANSTVSITGGTDKVVSHEYRAMSSNAVDWDSKKGWYMNLPETGERVPYNPEVRGGNLLRYSSVVPSADVCEAGGYSWDYYVDALTGANLGWSPYVDVTTPVAARKSTVGITPPGTLLTEGRGRGIVFQGGSTGELDYYKANLGQATAGRVAWREIVGD